MSTINSVPLRDLAVIVAGLVERGIRFEAMPNGDGTTYTIKLSGGY